MPIKQQTDHSHPATFPCTNRSSDTTSLRGNISFRGTFVPISGFPCYLFNSSLVCPLARWFLGLASPLLISFLRVGLNISHTNSRGAVIAIRNHIFFELGLSSSKPLCSSAL